MTDVTLQPEDSAALEKQLAIYSNRLAVLEETVDGTFLTLLTYLLYYIQFPLIFYLHLS